MTTASQAGTCPCCFGSFVVRKGKMVLHGYKRPGWGYIIGNCPATRQFEPYEVSCEGTKYMLGLAKHYLAQQTEYLRKLKAGEILEFSAKRERDLSELNLSWKELRNLPDSKRYEHIVLRKGDGVKAHSYSTKEWYQERLEGQIRETEQVTIPGVKDNIKFLNQKIAEWKPVNLTAKNEEAAALVAEEAKNLCPGSGTYDHDNSRMRFAYYKGGKCKHCGHFVTASKNGKMRKHPPTPEKK